ncbi:MAG: TylF/MycF/NovP-related O-methyltransferase [Candidatus Peribacteraceae bacterium]|nr:TylF/MycF/NovP-related O-methyltransferase [Candidatus Peribacteraceae bacterium]
MFTRNRVMKSQAYSLAKTLSVNDEKRLKVLAKYANKQAASVPGDFIEMGVFNDGSAMVMASALAQKKSKHVLHLLDSWEGLPSPSKEDEGTIAHAGVFSNSSAQGVVRALDQLQLAKHCRIHEGWFADTLKDIPGPFALAHIDCDFYDPVKECLLYLMPRMSIGGVIIIDDVGTEPVRRFPGVWKAVQECIVGTEWHIKSIAGELDQSAVLIR